MFEKMRDARFADRIIGRANPIPHHMNDDWRAVIRNYDHMQAVIELKIFRIKGAGS